jgi:D-alanyl-D-alanine carboxypeptidase
LIQRQVLVPLGLHHTTYAAGATIPSPATHGYWIKKGQHVDTTNWNFEFTSSAGSMASTIGDLQKWAPALATGNGILSPAIQQQRLMTVPTNIPGITYGLGIFRAGPFLGHDGEVYGYNSWMLYSPTQHVTLIVLGSTSPAINRPRNLNGEVVGLLTQVYSIASGKQAAPAGSPSGGSSASSSSSGH